MPLSVIWRATLALPGVPPASAIAPLPHASALMQAWKLIGAAVARDEYDLLEQMQWCSSAEHVAAMRHGFYNAPLPSLALELAAAPELAAALIPAEAAAAVATVLACFEAFMA